MLTRGRVDIGLFQLDWWHVGSPTVQETIQKEGFIWVMSSETLRTKCHALILLFSEVSGKITFQWLGPGVSWRLPPPPPLPSVIFLARQGCYPKLELKSVVELCCHVFDIISFQHSCTVDRCMDCKLAAFTLHESHSHTCNHYNLQYACTNTTESVVHAMDGSPAKPPAWLLWLSSACCPTSMAWVIRKTASTIDLTPGIIIPISGVLKHDQMESRFPDLLHQLSTLSLVPE